MDLVDLDFEDLPDDGAAAPEGEAEGAGEGEGTTADDVSDDTDVGADSSASRRLRMK